MVAGGHVWLWGGACVVAGGMRGSRGHAWLQGGIVVVGGACVVAGDMHGSGGHAWWWGGGMCGIQRDTVNERAVRILLECILVHNNTALM